LTFGGAVYITGGFDNSDEIRRLIQEKRKHAITLQLPT
jgi:predicted transcriptional regulator